MSDPNKAQQFIVFDLEKWEAAKAESPMDLEMAEYAASCFKTPLTEDQLHWWLRETSGIAPRKGVAR